MLEESQTWHNTLLFSYTLFNKTHDVLGDLSLHRRSSSAVSTTLIAKVYNWGELIASRKLVCLAGVKTD